MYIDTVDTFAIDFMPFLFFYSFHIPFKWVPSNGLAQCYRSLDFGYVSCNAIFSMDFRSECPNTCTYFSKFKFFPLCLSLPFFLSFSHNAKHSINIFPYKSRKSNLLYVIVSVDSFDACVFYRKLKKKNVLMTSNGRIDQKCGLQPEKHQPWIYVYLFDSNWFVN